MTKERAKYFPQTKSELRSLIENRMNYTHTKDVTVSCSATNSLQNSLKEIL